jgi:hypothetical protein
MQHEFMLRDTAAFEEFEELQQDYNKAWSNNRSGVGMLLYLVKHSLPDIANAV